MSPEIDVRRLESTTQSLFHQRGGLFPVMVALDRGHLVTVCRGGAGHLGREGRLDLVTSKDGGQSWEPPRTVINSREDDRNPAIGVTASGAVVLSYMHQASYADDGVYTPDMKNSTVRFSRSEDGGLTWTAPEELDPAVYPVMSPHGRVISLGNGDLLMPIYTIEDSPALSNGSYVLRSTDDGRSWGVPELVAPAMNEMTVALLSSGVLVAAVRETKRDAQRLAICRSDDDGRSWSEPVFVTEAMQHPGELVEITPGVLLLLYGNRQHPFRIEAKVSRDEGQTWGQQTICFSGALYGYDTALDRTTDHGYPTAVVVEDHLVVNYYVNPSRLQRPETRVAPESSFYSADGYIGVSVRASIAELIAELGDE